MAEARPRPCPTTPNTGIAQEKGGGECGPKKGFAKGKNRERKWVEENHSNGCGGRGVPQVARSGEKKNVEGGKDKENNN